MTETVSNKLTAEDLTTKWAMEQQRRKGRVRLRRMARVQKNILIAFLLFGVKDDNCCTGCNLEQSDRLCCPCIRFGSYRRFSWPRNKTDSGISQC